MHLICRSSACSCLTITTGYILLQLQWCMEALSLSNSICYRFSRHKLPAMWSSSQYFFFTPWRCMKNSSCSASHPFLQTCSKMPPARRLAWTVNCAEPMPHLPKGTCKSRLETSKHFPQTVILWCFKIAGGSFSSVALCHWESAQLGEWGQLGAEEVLQASRGAGMGVRGTDQEECSSDCLETPFFPPFCLQAGRDDPEETVSPLCHVLCRFSTNSQIKMGKGSGGRSEECEAT